MTPTRPYAKVRQPVNSDVRDCAHMTTPITLTKMEAARRQLRSAIELWFAEGDPVSVHTLAAAAHQIIHDLNRRNKGPDLLRDTKFIKSEYRNEFVSDIKSASNFMKHADRGKMGQPKHLNSTQNQTITSSCFPLLALNISVRNSAQRR